MGQCGASCCARLTDDDVSKTLHVPVDGKSEDVDVTEMAKMSFEIQATLVGTGAFGGSIAKLGRPFMESIDAIELLGESRIHFFMFGPGMNEVTLEGLSQCERKLLNPKAPSLGNFDASFNPDTMFRVVIAGFDPVSLLPHGVRNRVVSAEGQLSHATDLITRVTGVEGRYVEVIVNGGPQVNQEEDVKAYKSYRYLPKQSLDNLEGNLVLESRENPRAPNGDSREGWEVKSASGASLLDWKSVLKSFSLSKDIVQPFYGDLAAETPQYQRLVGYCKRVAAKASFVQARGPFGAHILFNEAEMESFFHEVRKTGTNGAGKRLRRSLRAEDENELPLDNLTNKEIWSRLLHTLHFNGVDFEHCYDIVGSSGEHGAYTFAETIILSHTLLLTPVMARTNLVPNLKVTDDKMKADVFEEPRPYLAVGMIGDCLKGCVWEQIKNGTEKGDPVFERQHSILMNPERLQQKMRSLVTALQETIC